MNNQMNGSSNEWMKDLIFLVLLMDENLLILWFFDDLCFHTYGGIFSFSSFFFNVPPSNPSLEVQIPVLRPNSKSWGPNPSLRAQILASKPKS